MRRVVAGLIAGVAGIFAYVAAIVISSETSINLFDLADLITKPSIAHGIAGLVAVGTFAFIEFLGFLPPALESQQATLLTMSDRVATVEQRRPVVETAPMPEPVPVPSPDAAPKSHKRMPRNAGQKITRKPAS